MGPLELGAGGAYGAGSASTRSGNRTRTPQGGVAPGTSTRETKRRPFSGQLNGTLTSNPYVPDSMTPGEGGATHNMGSGTQYRGKTTPHPSGYDPIAAANPYGSQSGPGILESWFNQRAQGTDPAFEYGLMRGNRDLADRYSAAGSFNSGAARQAESDLYANLLSQRMGQLDSLAAGASGEHIGRLGLMFNQGLGLAGGQSGLSSAYDLGAAGNMDAANRAQQQMFLNKAGVDQLGNQQAINTFGAIYGFGGNRNNQGGRGY